MRIINRAENWERAYEAFQQINFSAWDYDTIKESLLDYLKLYYPEDFNDYTENSDLIAVLELFAYIGELFAYRYDLNAHENFITVAQRKESVLRLAKLLSYSSSRNIPARGLVKLTSILTTERVFDSNGTDLSNRTIYWNDPNNPNWKEQFIIVINRVMEQEFGSVLPSDRVQVNDILFERYALNNDPLVPNHTIPFNVTVSGNTYPMEVVSSQLDEYGPYERRPEKGQKLNLLYLSDGLGDASDNTGFFYLVKQGTLQRKEATFDGITPNQIFDINVPNCNETDVWLNNIDPDTGLIITGDDLTNETRLGEWEQVDLANSQNVIFNTNPRRNKYEVETIADGDREDMFRLVFGDGKFANVPNGTFEVWYRISANENLIIPTSSLQNIGSTFTYRDSDNRKQTFSANFSLTNPIQNAVESESIEHIRRIAPAVYYTQDRMVNHRDYNEFPLQDNSILKLRAINRTFSGDSKYIHWHDPSEYYENVKIFGDDLMVYFKTSDKLTIVPTSSLPPDDGGLNIPLTTTLILNWLQPILQTEELFIKSVLAGMPPRDVRTQFTNEEVEQIRTGLQSIINNAPGTLYFNFDVNSDSWSSTTSSTIAGPDYWFYVQSNADGSFEILFKAITLIMHSDDVKFWITNRDNKVTTYDTFSNRYDTITILKANIGADGSTLSENKVFRILKQEPIDLGEEIGTESIHDLIVLPEDSDMDGIPDGVDIPYLINAGNPTFVYFSRESTSSPWVYRPYSEDIFHLWEEDQTNSTGLWKREIGKEGINFLWMHRTPRYHLIDPSATNIIDWFVIPRGYYFSTRLWLGGALDTPPIPPTPFQLKSDYRHLLENKMISDTVILHPGKFKIIFGKHAERELRATIKVIRNKNRTLTNNQIKTIIVDAVYDFFDIEKWEFGETFFFSELASYIHTRLPVDIDSVVLVPQFSTQIYGDLQQIHAKEDEIIQPSISVDDIVIIESLNPRNLKQTL